MTRTGSDSGSDTDGRGAGDQADRDAVSEPTTGHTAPVSLSRPGWLFWAIVTVSGLLYGQDLFQAITDAFGVPADLGALNALRAEAGQAPIAVPWLPIVVNLALPVVVFGVAFVIGRRRSPLVALLTFAAGLALVAALTLDMYLLAGLLVT